jgi:hypothetical protein
MVVGEDDVVYYVTGLEDDPDKHVS